MEYVATAELRSHGDPATIFLTNRECPFHCVMCDLWKNTTDERVPVGAIPLQIESALSKLPAADHVKLYNSGNFFDPQAIPPEDYADIAKLLRPFRTVIVENHPKLCGDRVLRFQELIDGRLEVAMGLETSHEETLRKLNKGMLLDDFADACQFLLNHQIRIRSFILLKPPWTSESEGVERAVESVRFAFDHGVECCAVIPTRGGNGVMEELAYASQYAPPKLESLEYVHRETLSWNRGRVFVDLWDAEKFAICESCGSERIKIIHQANLKQSYDRAFTCDSCKN